MPDLTRKERLTYGAALVLTLGVGVLLGRACIDVQPPPVAAAPRPVNICPCPPEEPPPPPMPVPKSKPVKKLPKAKPLDEHVARRLLLAAVRDYSSDLEPCRSSGNDVHRFAVTLVLDEDGETSSVTINAAPGEIPASTLTCVRNRIGRWTLPRELTVGKRQLMFGLSL